MAEKQRHPADWRKLGTASLIGALVGGSVSWGVNVAMIEVSLSPFFSVYFGSIFIAFGLLVLYKVRRRSRPDTFPHRLLSGFAVFMILSGISCFALWVFMRMFYW